MKYAIIVFLAAVVASCTPYKRANLKAEIDQWRAPCAAGDQVSCLKYLEANQALSDYENRRAAIRGAMMGGLLSKPNPVTFSAPVGAGGTVTY